MPHATAPVTTFQALILCGPGESLQPFTSNPDDFPKALVPIANRPMVWYALDWCYRSGISNITLVTPSSSSAALEAALSTNPHLTSLPSPRPTVLAPIDITLTTGTAEVLRAQQVQDAIVGDFIILPCDLVCELSGLSLLDSWMVIQGGLSQDIEGEDRMGRRGVLGVWYNTKDSIADGGVGVKKEETDFLATAQTPRPVAPPVTGSLRSNIEEVAITMPTAVLKDKIDEDKGLRLRHASIKKHGKLTMRATLRDAHVYLFSYWAKDFMKRNESFESIGEDVLGWWAKARWQEGLSTKLRLDQSVKKVRRRPSRRASTTEASGDFIDLSSLSSTSRTTSDSGEPHHPPEQIDSPFARRVPDDVARRPASTSVSKIPPLLAYIHSAQPTASLLRRVDTVPLLLSASLFIAKQPPAPETSFPFTYENKVHPSSAPRPELRLTLDQGTVLVDANVTFTSKSTIRESVIGTGCVLGTPLAPVEGMSAQQSVKDAPPGVRLQRCLLMEGAVVESGAVLNGCVLGRRCRVGKGCDLRDCFIQDGYAVSDGITSKGEVLAGFDEGEDPENEEGTCNSDGDD